MTIYQNMSLTMAGGWKKMIFKGLFQPKPLCGFVTDFPGVSVIPADEGLLQGLSAQGHLLFHPPAPLLSQYLPTPLGCSPNPVQWVLCHPQSLPQQHHRARINPQIIPITASKGADLGHICPNREGSGPATGWDRPWPCFGLAMLPVAVFLPLVSQELTSWLVMSQ